MNLVDYVVGFYRDYHQQIIVGGLVVSILFQQRRHQGPETRLQPQRPARTSHLIEHPGDSSLAYPAAASGLEATKHKLATRSVTSW